jgi:hypothetical protein
MVFFMKKNVGYFALFVGLFAASAMPAYAWDTAAITGAFTGATTSLTAAQTSWLGLIAGFVGMGLIYKLFFKS